MAKKKRTNGEAEIIEGGEIEHHLSPDFHSVYANSARVRTSFYDFSIVFGEISAVDDKLEREERVQVVMSPQHAKALLKVIEKNVAAWEERFGAIELPEGLV